MKKLMKSILESTRRHSQDLDGLHIVTFMMEWKLVPSEGASN
jgi:hypothetical protein